MSTTTYVETLILDHLIRDVPFSINGWYIGLFLTDPTKAGITSSEVSAGDYNRQPVTWTTANANSNEILWGPTTSSWGSVSYAALMDASASGNMIAYGAASVSVLAYTVVRIQAGNLQLVMV